MSVKEVKEIKALLFFILSYVCDTPFVRLVFLIFGVVYLIGSTLGGIKR